METVLQRINKYFISLLPEDVHKSTELVNLVVGTILREMKTDNPLFKVLFKKVFYGGSFYERLKICTPEEYDVDLHLSLPKMAKPVLRASDIPGFVSVQLLDLNGFLAQPETAAAYEDLQMLLDDDHYLSTQNVLEWMESMLKEILPRQGNNCEIYFSRGGPALTLHIVVSGREIKVDLVASFVFGEKMWPQKGFRRNPVPSKPEFSIIPKKPKSPRNQPISSYWRLSFQEQERCLINDKMFLKPAVRLLKKMRDTLGHDCIASYYLKTVVLHLVDRENKNFWRQSLSWVFLKILEEYNAFIARKSIPYYWDKDDNLIEGIDERTLETISLTLTKIVDKVQEYYSAHSERVALGVTKYLLTEDEYDSIFYDIMVCRTETNLSERECAILVEKSKENNTEPTPGQVIVILLFLIFIFYCIFGNFGK